MLPLLAASDYGIAVAIVVLFAMFLVVGWVIVQGTRAQLHWRKLAAAGDVDTIRALVGDEIDRWKTARTPKGADPAVWHGVQSAELADVAPDGVRVNATAEGQYATTEGARREVTGVLREAMKLTAKLSDMLFYDIPNVALPRAQVDIYTTYRDEAGSAQRCILSTLARREIADGLAWDEMDAEEVVRAFGGRYLLDDRGNPLPIEPEGPPAGGVPAAFYRDA